MRKAIEVKVAADDRARLEAIVADRNCRQKHVERARIVLLSADGAGTLSIMRQVGCAKATVWRWRTAFQNDFAARMDWSVRDAKSANHNPDVVVNGKRGREPVEVEAVVGQALKLDAAGTTDPDGDALRFSWFFYAEAGAGIPGQPLVVRRRPPAAGASAPGQGGIPSAPAGGPREPLQHFRQQLDGDVVLFGDLPRARRSGIRTDRQVLHRDQRVIRLLREP